MNTKNETVDFKKYLGGTMSSKTEQTTNKIKKTFLQLYSHAPLDSITVKQITETAGINRGTFYLHYFNLDDLITSIEDEQLEAIIKINNQNRKHYHSKETEDFSKFFIPTFIYMNKNKLLFSLLLGHNGRNAFRYKFQNLMYHNITQRYKYLLCTRDYHDMVRRKSAVEFTISGSIGAIVYWLSLDESLTPEEFAKLVANMVLNGSFSSLEGSFKNLIRI